MQKRKKKRNADYRESKTLSQSISTASCETQAQWLWDSYALATGSSPLERAGLEGEAAKQSFESSQSFTSGGYSNDNVLPCKERKLDAAHGMVVL